MATQTLHSKSYTQPARFPDGPRNSIIRRQNKKRQQSRPCVTCLCPSRYSPRAFCMCDMSPSCLSSCRNRFSIASTYDSCRSGQCKPIPKQRCRWVRWVDSSHAPPDSSRSSPPRGVRIERGLNQESSALSILRLHRAFCGNSMKYYLQPLVLQPPVQKTRSSTCPLAVFTPKRVRLYANRLVVPTPTSR